MRVKLEVDRRRAGMAYQRSRVRRNGVRDRVEDQDEKDRELVLGRWI